MAEVEQEPKASAGRSDRALPIAIVVICFLFGMVAGLASYVSAGPTLGLLFAPLLLATLFTPPLVLAGKSSWGIFEWLAIVLGIAAVWLFTDGLLLREWAACAFMLGAY